MIIAILVELLSFFLPALYLFLGLFLLACAAIAVTIPALYIARMGSPKLS